MNMNTCIYSSLLKNADQALGSRDTASRTAELGPRRWMNECQQDATRVTLGQVRPSRTSMLGTSEPPT